MYKNKRRKKGMTRKLVSLLLVCVMAITVLAGCSSATPAATTAKPAGTTAAGTTAAATTAAATTAKPLAPLELTWMLPIWEPVPDMNNSWWSRFFKETNTKFTIEWVPAADIATKFDLVLASGSLPDIWFADDPVKPTVVSAVQQGAFWDLTPMLGDYSKYPNLKANMTPNLMEYTKYFGKNYGIPRNRPQIDPGLFIRADWLTKLNMKMPTTLDEYFNFIKASVDQKLAGSETIGVPSLYTFEAVINNAYGASIIEKAPNGGIIPTRINKGTTDAVEFYRKLYENGLMPKEYFTLTYADYQGMFSTGKAATYSENIWRGWDFENKIKVTQPDAKVDVIIGLKGPAGNAARLEKGFYGMLYANKKLSEEKTLRWLDYMNTLCSPEWLEKAYFGWKDVHYTLSADGSKVMNDTGKKEAAVTGVQQVFPMMQNTWAKVLNPSAPKAYNDAKLAQVQPILKDGLVDPFAYIVSASWTKFWGKVSKEFDQKRTQCITGAITVAEYRAYVETLKADPDAQKAFLEFKDTYVTTFGKQP